MACRPTPSVQKPGLGSPSCGPTRVLRMHSRLEPLAAELSTRRSRRSTLDLTSRRSNGRCASRSCWGSSACSRRGPRMPASGTELRRHQIDALAGLLTELIATAQRQAENGNGTSGVAELVEAELDDEEDEELPEEEDEELVALEPDPEQSALSLPSPDRLGQDHRGRGLRRGGTDARRLILTHRRLLVAQFNRELGAEGYGEESLRRSLRGSEPPIVRIQSLFRPTRGSPATSAISSGMSYHLVIATRRTRRLARRPPRPSVHFPEPIYVGMTATEQLIAKQVSDVFPASVDDLPLQDAARRGLIAPLRCLRVPPAAAINSVPIVGGDFDQDALAKVLDHTALNQAAASLYRDRFEATPGVVYAAGVEHAYNLAQEFRAAGLRPKRCPDERHLSSWPRSSPPTSATRSTSSSTPCCWPRAGTRRARPWSCTWRRQRADASTNSASAGSCARTPGRKRASSSTSSTRARLTTSASSPSTRCSTRTSTGRAHA